jgi:hypothetical protein
MSRLIMINLCTPRVFSEGDLVLVYDQDKATLGEGKFNPLWHGPFIVRHALWKGAYELEYFEGNVLSGAQKWALP